MYIETIQKGKYIAKPNYETIECHDNVKVI